MKVIGMFTGKLRHILAWLRARLPNGQTVEEALSMPLRISSAAVLGLMTGWWLGLSLLLAGTANCLAGGQPDAYQVDTWTRENGLPQSAVTSVLQTYDGYIWVGTFNGLARFDGVKFSVFDVVTAAGLASSRITALFESKDHTLWIGHEAGEVSRMRDGRFETVLLPGSTVAGIIDISADQNGEIWVLRQDNFVQRVRDGFLLGIPKSEDPAFPLLTLSRDNEGRMWVASGQVLRLVEGATLRSETVPNAAEGAWYPKAAPARAGGLWLAGKGKLQRWNNGLTVQDLKEGPWGDGTVTTVMETSQGALVVGTIDRGLFIMSPDGKFRRVSRQEGLAHDWVRSLAEDREGTLWVGTGGGGLCAVKPRLVQMLPAPPEWTGRNVLALADDGQGGCWIGTEGDGIYHWRNGWLSHPGESNGLTNPFVWSLMAETNGTVWAGSWGGGIFRGQHGFFAVPPGLESLKSPVTALLRARSGDFWIGSSEGLLRWRDGVAVAVPKTNFTGAVEVRALMESSDGSIWAGLNGGGLVRWKDGSVRQWRRTDGLPADTVWSMSEDADGTLWIGTFGGGIARLRGDVVQAVIPAEGWPNRVICHIADDGAGNLWCGSYGGIFRVTKKSLNDIADGREMAAELVTFGRAEGLEALECSGGFSSAGWRAPDGRLWFSTSRGVAIVDPLNVATNNVIPPVVIEEFHVGGRRIDLAADDDRKFGPGRERVEFGFTALSYVAPQKVRFRYQLEGLESGWTELGSQRRVAFAAVPPGCYVFRVAACNNDGLWNETGASVAFRIEPQVWETWWFFGLVSAGSFIVIALGAVWLVRRRLRFRMELLERQRAVERERVRIAKDIHDDLGASLTRITLLSQSVRGEPGLPVAAGSDVDSIYATARELTRSMDEIVWAVNPRHDTLDSLVNYLGKFAQDFLSTAGVRCRLDAPLELPAVPVSAEIRHNLFLAFKEALNNVVRHSRASEVHVGFVPDGESLQVSLLDNGVGIAGPAVDGSLRRTGGNGLPNMRRRMEEVGGAFSFEPDTAGGMHLVLKVPLKRGGGIRP